MFVKSLESTAFSGKMADEFYKDKIIGDKYYGDVSFLSTMRAVLTDRIGDNKISLLFKRETKNFDDWEIELPKNSLVVYSVVGNNTDDLDEAFNRVSGWFSDCPGMEMQGKITKFFKPSFRSLNYIDRVNKTSVLFVENLSFRSMHYIQRVLLAILPWYFDKETGMTDDEKELFDSLTKKDPEDYLNICERMAKKHDFRSVYLKSVLGNFSKNALVNERDAIKTRIANCRGNIRDYYDEIQRNLVTINDLGIRVLGLDEAIRRGGADTEVLDYFISNKSLSLLSAEGKLIRFCVSSYLTYFDEDMAEQFIGNKDSCVYANCYLDGVRCDDVEKVMKAIFIDKLLKVRFYASYELNVEGNVRSLGREGIDGIAATYMTNPHIGHHNCLGSYISSIITALGQGDLLTAIEQCSASARSLNFADGIVINEFFDDLYNKGQKCIELPDGKVVDFRGALAFLEEAES